MSVTIFRLNSVEQAFGFHTKPALDPNISNRWINITTFLSWIPGLSLISAIFHFVMANRVEEYAKKISMFELEKKFYSSYVTTLRVRAVSELFQASVVLAVIDVIVTIRRFCPCCKK